MRRSYGTIRLDQGDSSMSRMRFKHRTRDPNQKGTMPYVEPRGRGYHRTLLLRRLLDGRDMALRGLPTTNARRRTLETLSTSVYSLHQRFDRGSHLDQAARRKNARLASRPSTFQGPAPVSRGTVEDQKLYFGIQTTRANEKRKAIAALRGPLSNQNSFMLIFV